MNIQKGISVNGYVSLVFLLIACNLSPRQPRFGMLPDTLTTKSGKISGRSSSASGIRVFKGIPYAQPPVGAMRWRAPQPVVPWENVFNAIAFGNNCMQGGGGPAPAVKPGEPANPYTAEFEINRDDPMSEDCLCLNIWTPATSAEEKLPVLVFIHGGGLGGGSGSIPLYDGEGLAKKGVIVVTINYRLSLFGFFSHPELSAEAGYTVGNFGILDQIEALKWVHENISVFGGDPQRVTIAGQSAGAWSVSVLMVSPLAKGLFQRAIAESGGIFTPPDSTKGMSPFYSRSAAEKLGEDYVRRSACRSVSELRTRTSREIMEHKIVYGFVGDGRILPEDIYKAFEQGQQADVPLLIGWNAHDAWGFGWQAQTFANLAAKSAQSPVFVYFFSKVAPGSAEEQALGAYHSAEIAYAYCNLDKWFRPWTAADKKLAESMSSYFANFIATGNPNGKDLPSWPVYRSDHEISQELGVQIKSIPLPGQEEYQYFNNVFYR